MPQANEHLISLKERLKPIDHHDLFAFEKEYLEKKKMFLRKKRMEREETYQKLGINPQKDFKLPISQKWVEIKEREEEAKKLEEEKEREAIHRTSKRYDYGKEVKKHHWPEVSKQKQKEIIDRKTIFSDKQRQRSKPLTSRISNSMIGGSKNKYNIFI